jgi:hypothetical protein
VSATPVVTREVILGRSAKIWQAIAQRPGMAERFPLAISHTELPSFAFTQHDRVWVLAYSRLPQDNSRMLQQLQAAGVAEIVYITSSSTIIATMTSCYEYPRAKKQAEDAAAALANGKVLTLGLVVETLDELPAGSNAATTIDEIAAFMLSPKWMTDGGKRTHLLRIVQRPFGGVLERVLYGLYGALMHVVPSKPCLLRPFDLVLRVMGMRWYGYTFLSNRLWTTTMTS